MPNNRLFCIYVINTSLGYYVIEEKSKARKIKKKNQTHIPKNIVHTFDFTKRALKNVLSVSIELYLFSMMEIVAIYPGDWIAQLLRKVSII